MNTENRIALVTGANRGMGLQTARELVGRGFRTLIAARSADAAKQAASEIGSRLAEPMELDVTNPSDGLGEWIRERYGRLDVLINNAGAFFEPTDPAAAARTPVLALDLDVLRRSLETNALGALRISQLCAGLLVESHGRIVNVSSSMGSLNGMAQGWPGYRMSKTLLNAVTRLLAVELAPHVTVNSVCPGWVRTDMGGPSAFKSLEEGVDTTLWLAVEEESGITGGFYQDRRAIPW